MVMAGGDGTCQARPHARSSWASATKARAMSPLKVNVCCMSRWPVIQAARPFFMAGSMRMT